MAKGLKALQVLLAAEITVESIDRIIPLNGTVAEATPAGAGRKIRAVANAAGGVDVSQSMGIDDSAPISAEAILAAAPDVLVVPAASLESVGGVEGLLEIGGLGQTPAGQNGRVLAYDDQLLLGNGPRTAQMLVQLRNDLGAAVVAAPTNPKEDS